MYVSKDQQPLLIHFNALFRWRSNADHRYGCLSVDSIFGHVYVASLLPKRLNAAMRTGRHWPFSCQIQQGNHLRTPSMACWMAGEWLAIALKACH